MKMETRNSRSRILCQSQGAITIFQIIPLIFIIIGANSGIWIGDRYGGIGLLVGGLIGGAVGWCCWRIVFFGICKLAEHKQGLRGKTNEQLRAMLRDPDCKTPQLVLLELGVRKQNMEQELPVIFEMLVSPLQARRRRGWFTLASVFPERAKLVSNYQADDSVKVCREKIQKLLPIQS